MPLFLPSNFPGRRALLYVCDRLGITLKKWSPTHVAAEKRRPLDKWVLRFKKRTIHRSPGFHAIDLENRVLYLETQPLYPDSYYRLMGRSVKKEYAHDVADWLHEVAHIVCHDPAVDIDEMNEFQAMFVWERKVVDYLYGIGLFTGRERAVVRRSHQQWGTPPGVSYSGWRETPPRTKRSVTMYSRGTARMVGILDEYFRPSWQCASWTPDARAREEWPERRKS